MEKPQNSSELKDQVPVAAAQVILFLKSRGATPDLEDLASLFALGYDYQPETDTYFASSRKSRCVIARQHRTTWQVCVYMDTDALTQLATLVLAVIVSTTNNDREVLVHFSDRSTVTHTPIRNGHFDRDLS